MARVKDILRNIFYLFRDAAVSWGRDRASIYAAAVAYYTVFSLAPLLVFSVTIAGFFVSQGNVQLEIFIVLNRVAGEEVARLVDDLIETNLANQSSSRAATLISFVVLLAGASGVFNQLKTALNKIWGIIPIPPQGWRGILFNIRNYAFSFLLVFGMGVLLLTFVIVDTFLSTLNAIVGDIFPNLPTLPPVASLIAPLFMLLFFAVIFKTLPDVRVRWRTVWWGALVTTILFALGVMIIGRVLVFTSTGSIYGAASALIILLVWIYFSAQIVMFGAEFTKAYAIRYGARIRPRSNARLLHEYYSEFYEELRADVASGMAGESVQQATAEADAERGQQPATTPASAQAVPTGFISPRRSAVRQTAAALLGLAAGLFIAFLDSLRRNR